MSALGWIKRRARRIQSFYGGLPRRHAIAAAREDWWLLQGRYPRSAISSSFSTTWSQPCVIHFPPA